MSLANAASSGIRSVRARCPCGRQAELLIERFPPDMAVRDVGLHRRCSACGRKALETEPVWPKFDRA